MASSSLLQQVTDISYPLSAIPDLDPLIAGIANIPNVFLGEGSHGTSEYYLWRDKISQRLIQEKGFSFVAVEGDWPNCYQVNRYIKGYDHSSKNAAEVLKGFNRWPSWLWANQEMIPFVEWLKIYNQGLTKAKKVGFYGLDVYSLWESLEEIIDYLEKVDPQAAKIARRAYKCFEPYARNPEDYALSLSFVPKSCEREVVELLKTLRLKNPIFEQDEEVDFNAFQNTLVVIESEKYYRTLIQGDIESWNVRDKHMFATFKRLKDFYGSSSKGIVWAHNTHVGDARATKILDEGEINIGQLAREEFSQTQVFLLGFGSYQGKVIAGSDWGTPMEEMLLPPAQENSWEDVLHQSARGDLLLILKNTTQPTALHQVRTLRAVGVVYDPIVEQNYNYVPTILPLRFDAFIYFDETRALHPLHTHLFKSQEPLETYPSGE